MGAVGLAALICENQTVRVKGGREWAFGGSREVHRSIDLYTGVHLFTTAQKKGENLSVPSRVF